MCVVVAYEKKGKIFVEKFESVKLDDILDTNKRKPIIEYDCNILQVGIGPEFEERFKKLHKIK